MCVFAADGGNDVDGSGICGDSGSFSSGGGSGVVIVDVISSSEIFKNVKNTLLKEY